MEQESMRIAWADGTEWIIKREDDKYFHRPEGNYGEWQEGPPPDMSIQDLELLFV